MYKYLRDFANQSYNVARFAKSNTNFAKTKSKKVVVWQKRT